MIGGGTGGFDAGEAERIMRAAFAGIAGDVRVSLVRYRPAAATPEGGAIQPWRTKKVYCSSIARVTDVGS